ncbi:uncharacterized protein L199_006363 [Kwoniella botswanensis]|uniref:uncharacterized protein n=1 Tax=Kwoniella botswanensis TaxID=1268659 RepID=UPI00315CEF34
MTTEVARANLDNYTIRLANDEQKVQHAKAGYDHWKKDSTFEQYWDIYTRERNESPWGSNDKLLTWVLVRKDDLEGEIYAGCETYLRKGFIKRKGSHIVEDTHLYGIASVVTPKQHLRNGYATRLLSSLHHELSSLPSPYSSTTSDIPLLRAVGSILWSDVGSTFYSRCSSSEERKGWVVRDSQNTQLIWKILPPTQTELPKGWDWIYLSDLPGIKSELSKSVKQNLEKIDTSNKSLFVHDPISEGTLEFVPTKGTWQRSLIIVPEPVGIRYNPENGSEGKGEETIVLFSPKMINIGDRFLITYVHNLRSEQIPTLLNALDIIASQAGQKEGWIWDLPSTDSSEQLIEAWKSVGQEREVTSGRRNEIDGHLLGVAWYGDVDDEAELVEGQMWTWM